MSKSRLNVIDVVLKVGLADLLDKWEVWLQQYLWLFCTVDSEESPGSVGTNLLTRCQPAWRAAVVCVTRILWRTLWIQTVEILPQSSSVLSPDRCRLVNTHSVLQQKLSSVKSPVNGTKTLSIGKNYFLIHLSSIITCKNYVKKRKRVLCWA